MLIRRYSEMKEDMNLKKHKESLVARMRLLDEVADSQLVNEFIELYEDRCIECQEDRLGCTVRPACSNRNFLNMLIELGVEPEDVIEALVKAKKIRPERYTILDRVKLSYKSAKALAKKTGVV